ncbi:MAG: hypothetical protein CK429_32700 [Mycobacterium sp.]|nr:MAG: hypothetical protein CK429_32700 [Mycobacterium sp.]
MPDPTDSSSSTSDDEAAAPQEEPSEPVAPPPDPGDPSVVEPVAVGAGSRAKSWEEGRPHWWAGFILGMVAVLISGSTAVWTVLKPDPAPVTVPAPVVNNYMPEAAGLPGQPTQPTPGTGCEVGDKHFAGWGPDRPMMASAGPFAFDYPTLNGYNEDPHYGDTRNFYRVKDADDPNSGGWSNEIRNPVRGKRYFLQVYVINSGYVNDVLTAKDVRVTVTLPNCRSRQIGTHGIVNSSNTYPAAIWGGVNFYSGDDFALAYVPDSAKLYNNAYPQGLPVPGTAFLEAGGQPLGYEKLDGILPAGFKYAGYFNFTVEVV